MRGGAARFALPALALLLAQATAAFAAAPVPQQLAIATGSVTGIYYQIGAAICRLLRDHPPGQPVDCRTEGTAGSLQNLTIVAEAGAALGLAQADNLHDAATGTGAFAGRAPDRRLRALFSPVVETLLVLTRASHSVPQIADLRGRRVSIGAQASGSEATFRQMMAARGWGLGDFSQIVDIRASLQARALCAGKVDAIAFVAANPVPVMQEATFACAARFVPVEDAFARMMVARHPYYVAAEVPGALYPNNPEPTPTIGVHGVVIANADASEELVYAVTRAVFAHLREFRTLHLAFADVTAEAMLDPCLFAPVHPGAARYYREAGLRPPRACLDS